MKVVEASDHQALPQMPPAPCGKDEKSDQDLVKLLQRAQAHQQEAQCLLALAEQLSRRSPAASKHRLGDRELVRVRLTERETNVAELLVRGMSNRLIARTLEISEQTVKNHLSSIFPKLGVVDRTQAVIVLMRGAEG